MSIDKFKITHQTNSDNIEVEQLLDAAFGIDRRTKTSYRLREGEQPLPGLSFIARSEMGTLLGCISFWQIHIGHNGPDAILLGPLAVLPDQQGNGLGQALMAHGITAAKKASHQLIILVGDAPYYIKAGFKQVPADQIIMPGPNDPLRLMYLEINSGVLAATTGLIRSPMRYQTALSNGTFTQ